MRMWIRDPGSCQLWIQDGKIRILDPEYGIRDKHPGTVTLLDYFLILDAVWYHTRWPRQNYIVDISWTICLAFHQYFTLCLYLGFFCRHGTVTSIVRKPTGPVM